MKKTTYLFAILFIAGSTIITAQNTWTQKANFGGGLRNYAVGFFIGSKGYVGTGEVFPTYYNDFWEYNPSTNVWTQKANFGGSVRTYAVGFAIGTKGYLGTGYNSNGYKNDFWEYNPTLNTWTQKANFGGAARAYAVGFAIGNNGYIGTGYSINTGYLADVWKYDPATDAWTQTASFTTGRIHAVGFSIGGKGYIGTGTDGGSYKNDFWEYNPATLTWTQKANFPGTPRINSVGFFIGTQGFIATGYDGSSKKDLWQYDPTTNTWTQKAAFSGTARSEAVGFSIGSKGYIGSGFTGSSITSDFWEYTPDSTICTIPINLSVTNITSTSAKLNWNAVPGAQAYRIRYKVDGTNIWIKKTTSTNSKTITGLLPSTTYNWEVQTFCLLVPHVKSDWSPAQQFTTPLRMSNSLDQQTSFRIYPNPAADHATIEFTLPQQSHVYLKVYDLDGKEIETVMDSYEDAGEHLIPLNTGQFSKGIYLVELISDFGIQNQKLIVQ